MEQDPALEEFRRRLDAAERELHEARRWLAQQEQARAQAAAAQAPPQPPPARFPNAPQQQPQPSQQPPYRGQPRPPESGPQRPMPRQQAGPSAQQVQRPRQQPQQPPQQRPQQAQGVPQQAMPRPHQGAQPPRGPQGQPVPQFPPQHGPNGALPPHGGPQRPPAQPWVPKKPRNPEDQEKTLIGVVAIAGTVITLIGVAFLVGMAIQAGLLGPLGRVILAYVVSLALGGAAWKFRGKAPEAGTTALLATSLYSALVTSLLVVTWLGWWPAWLGAIIMTMLFAAYMASVHYKPEGFHKLTIMWFAIGMALVSSILIANTGVSALPVLIMPLMVLGYSAWRRNDILRGTGALALLLVVANLIMGKASDMHIVANAVLGASAVLLVGLAVHFPTSRRAFGDYTAGLLVPALLLGLCLVRVNFEIPAWILVAAFAAIAAVAWGQLQGRIALGVFPVAFALAYKATQLANFSDSEHGASGGMSDVRLWVAVVLTAVFYIALVLLLPYLKHGALQAAWVVGVVILVFPLFLSSIAVPQAFREEPTMFASAVLLGLALIATWLRRSQIHGLANNRVYVACATVFALGLSMVAVVGTITGLGGLITGDAWGSSPWFASHVVVSVAWMLIAARLLIKHHEGFTGLGILLAIVATLKLTFFDLAALSGIFRALAFLLSGLVLLVIAVRRVRSTPTKPQEERATPQGHSQNQGPGAGPQA